MKQIILDTETTGLEPGDGHRVIEIGCVEIANRRATPNHFQRYLNPERPSDPAALAIHGLAEDFLSEQPLFSAVVDDFLDFIRGAELIIHNARFDVGFLDAELARVGRGKVMDYAVKVTDTMLLAREQFPGKRNSLDALCQRFEINNSHRTLHGALLDAELLAEVYVALTRGQDSLVIDMHGASQGELGGTAAVDPGIVLAATDEELAAHAAVLALVGKESKGKTVWKTA
jgi:DNA polymerase III subunit epsilon